jgi:hypothetical protein
LHLNRCYFLFLPKINIHNVVRQNGKKKNEKLKKNQYERLLQETDYWWLSAQMDQHVAYDLEIQRIVIGITIIKT